MRRLLVLLVCATLLAVLATPARAERVTVRDRERYEVSGVAFSRVTFSYGERRVKVRMRFHHLARGADSQYVFQIRASQGHTWSVGWAPREHDRFFTHFFWPGETATRVSCRVRWSRSFKRQRASVSFPASCLRYHSRPAPRRVRMGISLQNFGQNFLYDAAPGGNSVVGEKRRTMTDWIRRG